jgi:hypothetical protein
VRERLGRAGITGQPVDGAQHRAETGGIISEEPRAWSIAFSW